MPCKGTCKSEGALVGIRARVPQRLHRLVEAYDGDGEDGHADETDVKIGAQMGCGLQAGEGGECEANNKRK